MIYTRCVMISTLKQLRVIMDKRSEALYTLCQKGAGFFDCREKNGGFAEIYLTMSKT